MRDNPKDRRKHTRVSLQLEAELRLDSGITVTGKIKNISFSGVFINCVDPTSIPVGNDGSLKIFLQAVPHANVITFRCQVVRTDESGAGIRFINIDVEGYHQFKNLMIYNSTDPDILLAELEKNPGLDIYKSD
ncbi:MAG: PilZ domain-containing protein [Nitrospirae bacterium]|nr:PilZ domain-containing protein [Nitrospirota bacterium]